jgi:sulfatase modifying factor 1
MKSKFSTLIFLLIFLTQLTVTGSPVAYSGKVALDGQNLNGPTQFDFSIVNEEGIEVWAHSDDENATIEINLSNGRYLAFLGGQGMKPLPVDLFLSHQELFLKVGVDLKDGAGKRPLSANQPITASFHSLSSEFAKLAERAELAQGISSGGVTHEMLSPEVQFDLNRTIDPGSITQEMLSQSVIDSINKPLEDGALNKPSQLDPKFLKYFTPKIVEAPLSSSLIQGSDGSLSVSADGQYLNYQWFRNGVEIPNADKRTLILENAKFETDDANYSVVVSNDWGGVESALVKVQVLTSLPLISLLGNDPYQQEAALAFVDPGASAQDALGNDLSHEISVDGEDFNTSNLGSYKVLYAVTDAGGNTSTKERTVTVNDTLFPELKLFGDANITHLQNTAWVDPGVEAHDLRDGNITSDVVVSGTVDVNTTGTYTLTYTVSDAAGNEASITRTVNVGIPASYATELTSSVSLEMIWVEPGTFTMGSPESETGRSTNETQHEVTLTKGFYLGKYEVTQAQYEAVMTGNTETDSNGNVISATPSNWPNNPNRPVEMVSYDDIQKFLTRLNAQEAGNIPAGWAYVLPTEAQWEYACRAGTTTAYSWGDSITTSDANYNNSVGETTDVGQYTANPWGFFDMHGNVWEWTADWYSSYSSGAVTDPEGPATGSSRVNRGGSWFWPGATLRSASSNNSPPSSRGIDIGFRVGFQQIPADVASPEMQIFGDANITHLQDTAWVDPGVEAHDVRDGNLSADITVSGTVDVNTTGTYTLTYTVSDAAGNEASISRIVEVRSAKLAFEEEYFDLDTGTVRPSDLFDFAFPEESDFKFAYNANNEPHGVLFQNQSEGVEIAYLDDLPFWQVGHEEAETATFVPDLIDKSFEHNDTILLRTSTGSIFKIGNSVEVSNAVYFDYESIDLVGTAAPVISLLGDANVTHLLNTPWVDPGAEAHDEWDDNLTADIIVSGSVDVNTTGTYTLSYTVADSAGNEASITRTVRVVRGHTADLNSTVSMEMIWVEPGTFTMGQDGVATPVHEVTLTKGFYLGKYEVTQAQYEAVMTGNTETDSNGNVISATPSNWPNNPDRPVENVSWHDVQVFLTRLNAQEADNIPAGWAYVLPTEAQWEYACRAGTTTAYSWGDTITSEDANYNNTIAQTTDVGQYSANPWGFFDMHGNVWEWTADAGGTYASGAQTDPFNAGAPGSNRVRRGGSWANGGARLRSADRLSDAPSNRNTNLGFRVGLMEE